MEDGKDLESVDLIDVFAEDDILLSSSPRVSKSSGPVISNAETSGLSFPGSFETTNTSNSDPSKIEESISPIKVRDKSSGKPNPLPPVSDSPETLNSARRCYLRKSLAWDSAFFTGEGVLDPEELADVNSSFRSIQKKSLPKIPEAGPKCKHTAPPPKKEALKPPRNGSRIPVLPSSRQPSVNTQSTQNRGLSVKGPPVTATRKLSAVNARPPLRNSKDTCQVKNQTKKCGTRKVKPESASPSSSVDSFNSDSSTSSISLSKKPASSTPLRPTSALSQTQLPIKEVKPSGLRLPSPTVGYFEKGKSQPRGADRNSQKNQWI